MTRITVKTDQVAKINCVYCKFNPYRMRVSLSMLCCLVAVLQIQTVVAQRTITGAVSEQSKGSPLRLATVELLKKSNGSALAATSTDSAGKFVLSTADSGDLRLVVTLVGYSKFDTTIAGGTGDVEIPPVYLSSEYKQLGAATVTSVRSPVHQEVDRLVYDVQADPENKINTLVDMLRKVPLISVDADDNVKVKNSGNYKVLVNGKETSMTTNDPKTFFRSMAANNVQKIEVITTPPAKYDGEGLAGIINIVTVKKMNNGYSGSLSANYKDPNGPWGNGNINLKAGNFGLSAFAGVTEYNTPTTTFGYTQQGLSGSPLFVQETGSGHTRSNNEYASTQLSYTIDSLNLLTADLGYNRNNGTNFRTYFSNQTIDTASASYGLSNNGTSSGSGYDLGLAYQLGFKHNKGQLLDLAYKYTSSTANLGNNVGLFDKVDYDQDNYIQQNKTGFGEHSIQLDYTQPLKKVEMDAGAKVILRSYTSDYSLDSFDAQTGNYMVDSAGSNNFTYDQDIYSVYNSYQLNLHKWTIMAGLRDELTENTGSIGSHYNNLLPSLAIQDKFTSAQSINFGYSDRIQRPGIQQLNPFVNEQNPLFINYGDPYLKPELNHTFSASYSLNLKFSLNFELSYSFSDNTIQNVSTLMADGVTNITYQNLGKDKNYDANLGMFIPAGRHLIVNLNGQVSYVRMTGTVDTAMLMRSGTVGNATVYAGYKFGNDWRAGFTFLYFSPVVTLQSTGSPYYYTSLSVSKVLFKKLTISASASNPYQRFLDFKYKTADPAFLQLSNTNIVYRRFNIGINFRFGKLKGDSVKKSKNTINNSDIKVVPDIVP